MAAAKGREGVLGTLGIDVDAGAGVWTYVGVPPPKCRKSVDSPERDRVRPTTVDGASQSSGLI